MDSCSSSAEEKEEIFETANETIESASPGAESGDEEGIRLLNANSILSRFRLSEHEIWKKKPGSILERRKRLLTSMGLLDSTLCSPSVTTESSSSSSSSTFFTFPLLQQTIHSPPSSSSSSAIPLNLSPIQRRLTTVVSKKNTACVGFSIEPNNAVQSMTRSSSEGMKFSIENRSSNSGSIGFQSSPSPLLLHSKSVAGDRLADTGAVLRSGTIAPNGKPPLFDSPNPSFTKARAFRRLQAYLNRASQDNVNGAKESDKISERGKELMANEVGNGLKPLDTARKVGWDDFESSSALSPIVQEVLRRVKLAEDASLGEKERPEPQTKGGFFSMLGVKGLVKGASQPNDGDEGLAWRSGSGNDDSQELLLQNSNKHVKVYTHRKSVKEFTELQMKQEVVAHKGAIWTMKFSPDGCFLASAGQDHVVHVWEVLEQKHRDGYSPDMLGELTLGSGKTVDCRFPNYSRIKAFASRKKRQHSTLCPSKQFLLSPKPRCSFEGHLEDILDLSWSKSQYLLSSSMDKTVRLWHLSKKKCLNIFTHNDYVTCIQFNPTDDRHFISGSLDGKVRIWSIKDHQVVDWVDFREMVTAASYTPDGKGAMVGSYQGTCRLYKQSGGKLEIDRHFDVKNRGQKSRGKKITGFQFVCGDPEKVLITSSDSRIRLYDGTTISSEFKGFRNTKTQIYAASVTENGRHIVCGSEDSRVCIWTCNNTLSPFGYSGHWKESNTSYEDFYVSNVLVALPWPSSYPTKPLSANLFAEESNSSDNTVTFIGNMSPSRASSSHSDTSLMQESGDITDEKTAQLFDGFGFLPSNSASTSSYSTTLSEYRSMDDSNEVSTLTTNFAHSIVGDAFFCDNKNIKNNNDDNNNININNNNSSNRNNNNNNLNKRSATWPEEKPQSVGVEVSENTKEDSRMETKMRVKKNSLDLVDSDESIKAINPAWGMSIVTGGVSGEIRVFQNYGLPIRL